jgi:cytochrome c oxidase subunit II
MLVAGYNSSITARFTEPGERLTPCHQACGMGHHGMSAKVIDCKAFNDLAGKTERLSCVGE